MDTEKLRESAAEIARARHVNLHFEGDEAVLEFSGTRVRRPTTSVPTPAHLNRSAWVARRQPVEGHLVLLESASPAAAQHLRSRGAWFIDMTGRMYIEAPGLLIDVDRPWRTGPNADKASRAARPGGANREPVNLMSAGRARVIFALLSWPELAAAPVRMLATIAGTSIGVAQQVRVALREDEHLAKRPAVLLRPDDLLDQWAAAFPRGIASRTELSRFAGEPSTAGWSATGVPVHVSGEAAVNGLHGPGLVLYVPDLAPLAVVRSRWKVATDREANIIVRRQFWSTGTDVPVTNPGRWGRRELTASTSPLAPRLAPDVLVYADLLADRDPRHLEAASNLRKDILARLHAR
ncbi:type IV toxin-antitoxin system AbiEi family antitoxin [Cellulomonas sp. B6]|jgi:hypothetical protein|uniref:type IV toxin-antitoxin system AbiEi family antitoxin n=1 Tax=Cellulomonas sp. B6 TaxID=1295626 RepID=UPI00073B7DB8|nr:type IV toxin-antitoxin system AbiEi family antitoxin [Cellulomonas sp. B6]KSW30236.1 hypothetical protein ATM99_03995 [Cellulomonas sp. B6]